MNIGDMVINVVFNGAEQASASIGKTEKSFDGLRKMSLELKAAIVATAYAAGKMITDSGERAADLQRTNAITGESVVLLQKYTHATEQAGLSGVALSQSVYGIQKAFAGINTMSGGPSELPLANMILSQTDQSQITPEEAQSEIGKGHLIEYLMPKLIAIAKAAKEHKEIPGIGPLSEAMALRAAESMGFNADTFAGAAEGAYDPANIQNQFATSEQNVKKRMHLYKGAVQIKQAVEYGTDQAAGAVDEIGDNAKKHLKKQFEKTLKDSKNLNFQKDFGGGANIGPIDEFLKQSNKKLLENAVAPSSRSVASSAPSEKPVQQNSFNINQVFNNVDKSDAQDVADSFKKEVVAAYRVATAQLQRG